MLNRFYPTRMTILSLNICSIELLGRCSSQSCDSSGITKQHVTHAWRYTVVGVVVRCCVGDCEGRAASVLVTCCGAASLRTIGTVGAALITETGSGFPLMCYKGHCYFRILGAPVFMLIFDSDVWNA